jgi:NAD(P)H-dependent flavin oxidoreductase YrpB (nitropropane dioxygenase family)
VVDLGADVIVAQETDAGGQGARSMHLLRPCTFDQSVFPAVLGTRLPSPPSKVLGASGGEHD